MSRWTSVLFWSVIAAAFIGPGTVTTAASAGALHGGALLWALVFSTGACLVLQESAARLTIVSGRNLGQALREHYAGGLRGPLMLMLVLGAILLGCAAYEAGNILGGVAGAVLGTGGPPAPFTLAIGVGAAMLLWFGATHTVARALGLAVALMGVTFLVTAWRVSASIPESELMRGALVPLVPEGSGLLVLGLVGTTVVPYNLFLGSGLARGQSLRVARHGLAVAILIGGVISMGIVVVGTAVDPPFGFEALGEVLRQGVGGAASSLFALGLFAAGFTSAITAPLAAAITARSLFAGDNDPLWNERSLRYRAVWLGVLSVGVAFGLSGVRPIPAIILAQALNGVLLPLIGTFLLFAVNDRKLMRDRINGRRANVAFVAVVLVAMLLGVGNVVKAVAATFDLPHPGWGRIALWTAGVALVAAGPVAREMRRRRGTA